MDNYSKALHKQIISELKSLLGTWLVHRDDAIRIVRGWEALETQERPHGLDNPRWSYAVVILKTTEILSTKILVKTRLGCPRYVRLGESDVYAPISRETLFEALLVYHGILN